MIDATTHPLRIRDFRFFWVARFASTLAQTSFVVVIGWQVYETARRTMGTKDASLQLGIVGILQFLPLLLLTLISGYVADTVDRRLIARACLLLQLCSAVFLTWANVIGALSLSPLFAVAVALGIVRAFSNPALNAMAPQIVPHPILPRAIAMNQIASRLGAILGPAIGGYLYAVAPWAAYAGNGALFAAALGCALLIRPLEPIERDRVRKPWQQMLDGLRYVRGNSLVLGAISLDLVAVLLGGATAMLPPFAYDVLKVGPAGLGHLRAAPAVGALATALFLSHRPLGAGAGRKMLWAVAVFGAATSGFGLSRWMPLSLLFLAALGAADMLSVYVRQSLIQLYTPNAMRGRVGAVSTLFVSASNELGEAESGFVAALIGPVAAVIAGGIGAIATALLWARLFPALTREQAGEAPER